MVNRHQRLGFRPISDTNENGGAIARAAVVNVIR